MTIQQTMQEQQYLYYFQASNFDTSPTKSTNPLMFRCVLQ